MRFAIVAPPLVIFLVSLTAAAQTTNKFFDQARSKYLKGDYVGAIADYTRDIALHPSVAVTYNNRGIAKKYNGDVNGAIADFSRAIELKPEAWYFGWRAECYQEIGKRDEAIADLTKAMELDPTSATRVEFRGKAKLAKGDLDGAIADFTQASKMNPKVADYLVERADALKQKGDLDAAIADYTAAAALDPKSASILAARSFANAAKGNTDAAIADATRAIELAPKDSQGYFARAYAKRVKWDVDGAIEDLNRGLELSPDTLAAYGLRGRYYAIKQEWAKALDDLQLATNLEPVKRDYHELVIWYCNTRAGKRETAGKDLARHLASCPKEKSDEWPIAIANFLLDKTSEKDFLAGTDARNAKPDSSEHCDAWFYLGMKRILADDKGGAADAFKKSVGTQQKDRIEFVLSQAELKKLSN